MTPRDEIARRRTFAIISHPDAGKTTLTEKFLLYGGAVQLAGSVTARKNQRAATSDWMELEKQRGISISSTVLQFEYNGYCINLLDTPGHKDFSEDTYRVLTAVDAVIMIIDAGKGIESQTRKLFEICRRRRVPIFTFMNKADRPTLEPLALMDELERVLGIGAFAMNWPLGNGPGFRGVFDRVGRQAHFFDRTAGGAYRAPVHVHGLNDPQVQQMLPEETFASITEEIAMLDIAGESLDTQAVLDGRMTPVFFGSASNNFGVQLLLDTFLSYSMPPRPRHTTSELVDMEDPRFSGFIFKIQANMDPRHRDRIAFMRVCSGQFTRDMAVTHVRTGKKVRLSSSHRLFGRDRETVDIAWPGDVIGLVGHDSFAIGDTLADDPAMVYKEIPRFAPEVFAYLHCTNSSQSKQFRQGLDQLLQEGVVHLLEPIPAGQRVPLLGAVGPLQFEVVQHRLRMEYGAESRLERAGWSVLRWIAPDVSEEAIAAMTLPAGAKLVKDSRQQKAIVFPETWSLQYFTQRKPEIRLSELPSD